MKKYSRHFVSVALLVAGTFSFAPAALSADIKKVNGTFTFYGDQNDSPAMCKQKALEGARVEALSKEFGTIVSQDVMLADRVDSKGESSNFFSLSATEVKGEWIANEGEPVFQVSLSNDGCLIVSCQVKGLAKAITNEAVDFEAVALRNGAGGLYATTEYTEGDDLFIKFKAPIDGYAAIFLMQKNGETLKMLPYQGTPSQEIKIKKGYDYVFFDTSKAQGDFGEIDPLQISTDGEIEFNKLFVFFSPNAFSMPVMNNPRSQYELPYLTEEDFNKWLIKMRRNDAKLNVKQINLKLSPK